MRHRAAPKGFLLIEVIVAVSVVTIVITSILTIFSFVSNSEKREFAKLQAHLYAQEAMEATTFVAQFDWNEMQDGTWHPEIINGRWELVSGSELLDSQFTRTITIASVNRDQASRGHAYSDIVTSGGTNDPETKDVTVTVQWTLNVLGTQTVAYQSYVARDWSTVVTQNDWSGGPGQANFTDSSMFFAGNNVDYSAPGVLSLSGNLITWDNATTTAEYDLVGNIDADSIFVVGQVLYEGTLNNSPANNSEFYAFDISDLTNPILLDDVEIGADVRGIYADGSYAALATSANASEIQVYDISDPSNMLLVETVNLPSNSDATDLDVTGGHLHVSQGTTLYTFDYSDPTSLVQTDSLVLGADVLNAVSAQGRQVYVASNNDAKEFQVVDVTDPSDTYELATYDLPGNRQGLDIYAFGFRAFISTQNSGTEPEFYMLNISNPATPTLQGTYEGGETIFAVAALSNFAFVGTNLNNDDILVLDVADPQNIFIDTGYEIKGTATDIFVTPEAIYISTTSNDSELIIISVNSSVPLYPSSGYAESSTFDTQSASSTYNWLQWLDEVTSATDVKFQVATNNDNATWSYLGPDGTSNTFYTTSTRELINYSAHLNNRYLRYRVTLESLDQEQSPLLYSVEASYSQ